MSDKPTMNMISQLRRQVKANGTATIGVEEFNKLQAEWITRASAISYEPIRERDAPMNEKRFIYLAMGRDDDDETYFIYGFTSLDDATQFVDSCAAYDKTRPPLPPGWRDSPVLDEYKVLFAQWVASHPAKEYRYATTYFVEPVEVSGNADAD